MSILLKVTKSLFGWLLVPFFRFEERKRDKHTSARFVVPFFVAFGLDVAVWFLGWHYYTLSLWNVLASLDFQNLLLLSMAAVTVAVLALSKTGGVRLFSITKTVSLAAALDVAVWALCWLQYAHSDFKSVMEIGVFQLTVFFAMVLVLFAFLVFAELWNADSYSGSASDDQKEVGVVGLGAERPLAGATWGQTKQCSGYEDDSGSSTKKQVADRYIGILLENGGQAVPMWKITRELKRRYGYSEYDILDAEIELKRMGRIRSTKMESVDALRRQKMEGDKRGARRLRHGEHTNAAKPTIATAAGNPAVIPWVRAEHNETRAYKQHRKRNNHSQNV